MPKILRQRLSGQFYRRPGPPPQEGLLYKINPPIDAIAERGAQEFRYFVHIPSWPGFIGQIDELRNLVDDLVIRSRFDKKRGDSLLDEKATWLAKKLLPPRGLAGIIKPGFHPEIEIDDDYASLVPWEFLQEFHWACPECNNISETLEPHILKKCSKCGSLLHCVTDDRSFVSFDCLDCGITFNAEGAPFCTECGTRQRLRLVRLATDYFFTHYLPPQGGHSASTTRFLIIDDPTCDLEVNGQDQDHITKLRQAINDKGFNMTFLRHRRATRDAVLKAIGDTNLAGIFFFGHGCYDKRDERSLLVLNDGPLMPEDIEEVHPQARFVFLNACYGGALAGNWGIDGVNRSIALAFAHSGLARVVIAPICPVVNKDAAKTAKEFLEGILANETLGEALMRARQQSLQRYEQGAADISWMAYRYFGDPNISLPEPYREYVEIRDKASQADRTNQALPCRIFDSRDNLQRDVFAFGIDAVLLRAAKRRILQNRQHVTVPDFIAGLVRRGELTRYFLVKENISPDKLYDHFSDVEDPGEKIPRSKLERYISLAEKNDSEEYDKEQWHELAKEWFIEKKSDLVPELVEILIKADQMAQRRRGDVEDYRISEEDLLRTLVNSEYWPSRSITMLPNADSMRNVIQKRGDWKEVDANGEILLNGLTKEAKKTIRNAYSISLRRGVCPISSRAMLAGITTDVESYGARIFMYCGYDPKFICSSMKAVIRDEEQTLDWFGLGVPACSRIITPTLEKARGDMEQWQNTVIKEADLFHAFWQVVDTRFKQAIDKLLQIDPNRLVMIAPEEPDKTATKVSYQYNDFTESKFDETVWRMLTVAANIALAQGVPSIKTPHLFVGMISHGKVAREFLQQNELDRNLLTMFFLSTVPRQPYIKSTNDVLELSKNVRRILSRAFELTREANRARTTEIDLFKGFFAEGGSIVGETLRRIGITGPLKLPTMQEDQKDYLNVLGERLSDCVVGQFVAIRTILDSLRKDPGYRNQPWRVFIFLGSPGVGRGMVSRITGEWLYGNTDGTIQVDFTERQYMNSGSEVSKKAESRLRDKLAEWLTAKPCSVLVFNGIDGIGGDNYAMLTQLLSEGRVIHTDGRIVSARNAMVVIKCESANNYKLQDIIDNQSETSDLYNTLQDKLIQFTDELLPNEIREMIDAVIPFRDLDSNDLRIIAERTVTRFIRPLKMIHNISVDVDAQVWSFLVSLGIDGKEGAELIIDKIRRDLFESLIDYLDKSPGNTYPIIRCKVIDDKITLDFIQNRDMPMT